MGTTAKACCCCGKEDKDIIKVIHQKHVKDNLISLDYFLNLIPKNILNQMNKEEFPNYNNKGEIRTEKIPNENNSFSQNNENIKEMYYHGEFNDSGRKDGIGKMILINDIEKKFYHGIWENDNLNKGKIYYSDGSIYIGEINNFMRHGKGKFVNEKENYDGYWKDDQKDGDGTLIFSDNTQYIGKFKNNKFNGKGKMTWKNGILYEGDFKSNNFNGSGYLKGSNGHIYKGEFQNGKYNRKGIFQWINNDSNYDYYSGNYSNGQKDGKGEFHFSNGHIYNGLWKCGKPDGEGIYESENRKYHGNWRSGIFMQLIDVEPKEKSQEENLNLTFNTPVEDIYIPDHIETSLNTDIDIGNSNKIEISIINLK